MEVKIEQSWKEALGREFGSEWFAEIAGKVRGEYAAHPGAIFPPASQIFAAFDASAFDKTKVVILGQDPYHGPGQANGLAFSVNPGVAVPPSLRNIFTEIHNDVGTPIPPNGDLSRWAEQGVLLLNSSLTVPQATPKGHSWIGWEQFTDAAVRHLAEERDNLVFLLWGSDAIRKGAFIDRSRHLVLTAPHPSPLSAHRGFFGCRHFSQANAYLAQHGQSPIIW